MSVHVSGTLTPTTTDLQITHRGAKIALKVIDWAESSVPVVSVIELVGAVWQSNIIDELDDGTVAVIKAQGMANYLRDVLRPKFNAWLLARFPATGPVTPPPDPGLSDDVAVTRELDRLLFSTLIFAPQADGTLRVALK